MPLRQSMKQGRSPSLYTSRQTPIPELFDRFIMIFPGLCEASTPVIYMVNQKTAIPTEVIQMIKGKMSVRLSKVDVAEISLETPLEDLGLDSLDKLCLLFEIEDHFNVAIPDTTASQMKCGADILAFVSRSPHKRS